MQINLSKEIIRTVCNSLRNDKNRCIAMLRQIEAKKAAKEIEEDVKKQIAEVESALQVFEEISK